MTEGHQQLTETLRRLAAAAAAEHGVELVELALRGSSRKRVVRVDIDRAGPAGVDLGDCRQVSKSLGRMLDEDELISGRFNLEVSSPGIDRPIATTEDIRRNTGRRIVVTTTEPVEGSTLHRGVLLGDRQGALSLRGNGDEAILIPLDRVEKVHQDVGL